MRDRSRQRAVVWGAALVVLVIAATVPPAWALAVVLGGLALMIAAAVWAGRR